MNPAQRLAGRILDIFGIGHLQVVDDTGDQQTAQMTIQSGGPAEEIIDGRPRLGDYGIAYCPPDGSEAITIFVGGRRSSGVIIATGHKATRIKNLQPGEVQIYNGLTGAFVKFAADGSIQSKGNWTHTGNFSATGDITDRAQDGKGQSMEASRQVFDGHTHPVSGSNTLKPSQQEPD